MPDTATTLARELNLKPQQINSVQSLLNEGATIPFISRYRKEATGGLDEVVITTIRDRLEQRAELEKRRTSILESLEQHGHLTPQLKQEVEAAQEMTLLEDIYLPYRPKRRTRATIAREKGLEPLARELYQGNAVRLDVAPFVNPEKDIATEEEALAGSRDIMAEWISEDRTIRDRLRAVFSSKAIISARVIEKNKEQGAKFRDYFDWSEPISKLAGHRYLAMLRGEQEKILRVSVKPSEEQCLQVLNSIFRHFQGMSAKQIRLAMEDSYKRLLAPSLENELRADLKLKADQEAIAVFTDNLKELLLASPLGAKRVMALDPGFRTGAKLVCLDRYGTLIYNTTIFPTQSEKQQKEAAKTIQTLCTTHDIEAICIGNGTAGRETESFVRGLDLPASILITMVDESGASIYSASAIAREEFPDLDLTVRGAISIGRRLQDPLAELVKLDPKAIGVGQYQHDVDQSMLKKALDETVMHCVNHVGVELNHASVSLLTYVSGLGPALAEKIVQYRWENGPFASRKDLLKVPRLGKKAFEQCAGFLRIHGAENPLDNCAVHPERYQIVRQMAKDCGCTVKELIQLPQKRKQIQLQSYVQGDVGMPTLEDIMTELEKPGRDPRTTFTAFQFAEGVNAITDLQPDMVLPGIVTNVTKFGAFVDIGVHQDGLVHISQLADTFVKDPNEFVKVRQKVRVRVLEVDTARKRISLSMKDIKQ
ncbi:Tex family protein [Desulfogranum japonicum]|uniref:Tex family protein n=1 Tax=Desulfogranum japonicum TaxID=231447 RepID=UPI0004018A0E|nr:Tex family protein [Desulfogranum japonicum]